MKKLIIMTIAAVSVAVAAQAADVSTTVDFASAYVFRGVTLNNGLVMQPGAEISGFPIDEAYGSVAIGIWGNYDINDEDRDGSDLSEIDYYISYTLPIETMDVSVAYTEYTHDKQGVETDKELNLTVGSAIGEDGLYASFAANYGVGGYVNSSWYLQGALDYEIELSDALTASAGVTVAYVISDGDYADWGIADGFGDATGSVGLAYALNDNWSISGDLTYIAQIDDDVLPNGDRRVNNTGYDVDFVASIGVGCDF